MDNVTHSLFGLALHKAGLGRKVRHGGLLWVLSSNLPDLDIAPSIWGGDLREFEVHRGLTHSLVVAPVEAALFAGLLWLALRRTFSLSHGFLITLGGIGGHILLDEVNRYGVRLFAPISNAWYHLDLNQVVDLGAMSLLAGALLAAWLAHRRAPASHAEAWLAWGGLALLMAYEGARLAQQRRALALAVRERPGEGDVRRMAFPQGASLTSWTVLTRSSSECEVLTADLETGTLQASSSCSPAPDPADAPVAAAALTGSRAVQAMAEYAEFPCLEVLPVSEPPGSHLVRLMDLRWGMPGHPRFAGSAIVDPSGKILADDLTRGDERLAVPSPR